MGTSVRTTSSTAVVSPAFGVISCMLLVFIGAIVTVARGHAARNDIRRAPPESIEGDGLTVAGMIPGHLNIALFLIPAMFFSTILGMLALHVGN